MSGLALVTGASAGLGEAYAKAFAARGQPLVLVARRRDRLDALARSLRVEVEVIEADLRTDEGLRRVEGRLARGDVEILVNNAGVGPSGAFADVPLDRQLDALALNVVALTRLTHAAVGPMRARKRGWIVQLASLAAFQPNPYFAVYGASKAYVLSFSEALHEEVRGDGVQVLVVCPGFTHTEFQAANGTPAEFLPEILWSRPEQVVEATLARLDGRAAVLVPRWHDWLSAQLAGLAPRAWVRRLAGAVGRRV